MEPRRTGKLGRRSARSIGSVAFLALLASPGLALACTLAATPIDHVPAWFAPPAGMALPANAPALVWSPAFDFRRPIDASTGAPLASTGWEGDRRAEPHGFVGHCPILPLRFLTDCR